MAQLPVFYINLASRPERRAFMENQFSALGIAAERVEAVLPESASPEDLKAYESPDVPWGMSRPALACALSHRAIWRHMAEAKLPSALILEDDVVLDPAIRPYLDPEITHTAGCGLLRLETWGNPVRCSSRPIGGQPGMAVRRLLTTHPGAAAYIIGRRVAEASLRDPRSLQMEVDRYLFGRGGRWLTEIAVGQALPAPCIQLRNQPGSAELAAARSSLEAPKRKPDSAAARKAQAQLNRHYLGHVLRRMVSDPATLFSGAKPVPFAGSLR